MTFPLPKGLTHAELLEKHRVLKAGLPEGDPLLTRMRRAISWLGRAEKETADPDAADPDAAFIFYWIAFNAAYAADIGADLQSYERDDRKERNRFQDYFQRIISLDEKGLIYGTIDSRFYHSIRHLLNNKFIFQPFWSFHNRISGYADWEQRFAREKIGSDRALKRDDGAVLILNTLFDRLYTLRNQLVHGGATWNSDVNRHQVRDGAEIMAFLVPVFIDLMLEHPEIDWGPPYYPRLPAP